MFINHVASRGLRRARSWDLHRLFKERWNDLIWGLPSKFPGIKDEWQGCMRRTQEHVYHGP